MYMKKLYFGIPFFCIKLASFGVVVVASPSPSSLPVLNQATSRVPDVYTTSQTKRQRLQLLQPHRRGKTRQQQKTDIQLLLRGGSSNQNSEEIETIEKESSVSEPAHPEQEKKMSSLTKIRQTIFPIHGPHEVKKFLLIGSIKFFII